LAYSTLSPSSNIIDYLFFISVDCTHQSGIFKNFR